MEFVFTQESKKKENMRLKQWTMHIMFRKNGRGGNSIQGSRKGIRDNTIGFEKAIHLILFPRIVKRVWYGQTMPVACYLKYDVFHQPYLQIANILKLVKTCIRQKSYGVILQESKKNKTKQKKTD